MPPSGVCTCTPGTVCSCVSSVSRQSRRWATSLGTDCSAPASAASPARCTNTGAQEVLNSISLPVASSSAGGTTSQPRRQPVISQDLEKVLVLMMRSSSCIASRNEGATPPAP